MPARLTLCARFEIVRMVAQGQGQRTSAVASRLHVSKGTVKTHLHNIYDKLKLDGRVALTVVRPRKGSRLGQEPSWMDRAALSHTR